MGKPAFFAPQNNLTIVKARAIRGSVNMESLRIGRMSFAFALFLSTAAAVDNSVGLLPPMGWRSCTPPLTDSITHRIALISKQSVVLRVPTVSVRPSRATIGESIRAGNCYGADVDQAKMESIFVKITNRSRVVDGKPTSLADLGYVWPSLHRESPRRDIAVDRSISPRGWTLPHDSQVRVGLDDNWQACGAGVNGSFHTIDGRPIINEARFPDMKAMTVRQPQLSPAARAVVPRSAPAWPYQAKARSLGLKPGWYMNNCRACSNRPGGRNTRSGVHDAWVGLCRIRFPSNLAGRSAPSINSPHRSRSLPTWISRPRQSQTTASMALS
jgi:alpha-galactosidase